MSGQRVTSSLEAKPCLANAAVSVRWRTSASGRGKDLPGLFILQGSATSLRMTLAVGTVRRKRAASPRHARAADLLAWYDRHRRALHLHACAKAVVAHHGGSFPQSEAALADLPGVGPYTAAAIAAIAFDTRVAAVDGNVERVVARLYAVEDELPAAKQNIRRLAECLVPVERAGDFAQALMDLGATICTPKTPTCALCPWRSACAARRRGDPEAFPLKAPKKEGRLRRGAAFV